jgi:hypothetical protein
MSKCELCAGTGWYGDKFPGAPGNTEITKCDCGTAKKCTVGWHQYHCVAGMAWCMICGLEADMNVCRSHKPDCALTVNFRHGCTCGAKGDGAEGNAENKALRQRLQYANGKLSEAMLKLDELRTLLNNAEQ